MTEMTYANQIFVVGYVPEYRAVVSGDGGITEHNRCGQLVMWNADTTERQLKCICEGAVVSIAHAPDLEQLISADRSGKVTAWDVKSGTKRMQMSCRDSGDIAFLPMSVAYVQEVRAVVCGEANFTAPAGRVAVLDVESGERRFELECAGPVMSVAFAAPLGAVVAGDRSGAVGVWDLASRQKRQEIRCRSSVNSVLHSITTNVVVSGEKSGAVNVWRI